MGGTFRLDVDLVTKRQIKGESDNMLWEGFDLGFVICGEQMLAGSAT